MANILRMDLYRLVHGKSLWILLAVIVAMAVLSSGLMAYIASPEFTQTLQSPNGAMRIGFTDGAGPDASDYADAAEVNAMMAGSMTPQALVGSLFLNGGGLACLFVIFIAIFLAAEFESGFSKNVFTAQPNRLAFLAVRTVEIVVLAAVFTLVTSGATIATAAAVGFELIPTTLPDLLLWGALVTLGIAGFGMLTALVVWLTRKMSASLVVGILLAAGMATILFQGVALLVPDASFLMDFTLSSCLASLSKGVDAAGGLSSVHIALVSAAFIVGSAAVGGLALQKRNV